MFLVIIILALAAIALGFVLDAFVSGMSYALRVDVYLRRIGQFDGGQGHLRYFQKDFDGNIAASALRQKPIYLMPQDKAPAGSVSVKRISLSSNTTVPYTDYSGKDCGFSLVLPPVFGLLVTMYTFGHHYISSAIFGDSVHPLLLGIMMFVESVLTSAVFAILLCAVFDVIRWLIHTSEAPAKTYNVQFTDGSKQKVTIYENALYEMDTMFGGTLISDYERDIFRRRAEFIKKQQEAAKIRAMLNEHPVCPVCRGDFTHRLLHAKRAAKDLPSFDPDEGKTYECYSCGYKW